MKQLKKEEEERRQKEQREREERERLEQVRAAKLDKIPKEQEKQKLLLNKERIDRKKVIINVMCEGISKVSTFTGANFHTILQKKF